MLFYGHVIHPSIPCERIEVEIKNCGRFLSKMQTIYLMPHLHQHIFQLRQSFWGVTQVQQMASHRSHWSFMWLGVIKILTDANLSLCISTSRLSCTLRLLQGTLRFLLINWRSSATSPWLLFLHASKQLAGVSAVARADGLALVFRHALLHSLL